MHRKSLEAADKLKDCDQSDADSKDNMSDHCSDSSPSGQNMSKHHQVNDHHQEKLMASSSPITSSAAAAAAIYNSVLNKGNIKEELRTSSIAALRAKAMEHSAKVQANTIIANNKTNEQQNSLFSVGQNSPSNSPSIPPSSATQHLHFRHSPQSRPAVYWISILNEYQSWMNMNEYE